MLHVLMINRVTIQNNLNQFFHSIIHVLIASFLHLKLIGRKRMVLLMYYYGFNDGEKQMTIFLISPKP